MSDPSGDKAFTGSIPEIYDRFLVPLIFDFYAADLANRLAGRNLGSVLEIAAGTGVVTRQLAAKLPASVAITSTDLNQPMIDQARKTGTARAVEWRQADATNLPFPDRSFDAVVCQFGVMFFPDKPKAYAQALRVLKPGGLFLFNVWDRIEDNEFADTVTTALASVFPNDPPRFMARTPHGYHDRARIDSDLRAGRFTSNARYTTLAARSIAPSADIPALAYCQGTPLRTEIESRGSVSLGDATAIAASAVAKKFGKGRVEGKIQALVIEADGPAA
jgi:ubiquinone/menaquinone biosynthesis C-methylase UbiE